MSRYRCSFPSSLRFIVWRHPYCVSSTGWCVGFFTILWFCPSSWAPALLSSSCLFIRASCVAFIEVCFQLQQVLVFVDHLLDASLLKKSGCWLPFQRWSVLRTIFHPLTKPLTYDYIAIGLHSLPDFYDGNMRRQIYNSLLSAFNFPLIENLPITLDDFGRISSFSFLFQFGLAMVFWFQNKSDTRRSFTFRQLKKV